MDTPAADLKPPVARAASGFQKLPDQGKGTDSTRASKQTGHLRGPHNRGTDKSGMEGASGTTAELVADQ